MNRAIAQYQDTDKLDDHGMGVVWKATDTTLGREVAIKTLPADLAALLPFRTSFLLVPMR